MPEVLDSRQRFIRSMHFQPVDRCCVWHIGQWPETLARWHDEGLPADVTTGDGVARLLGFDYRLNMGLRTELDPPIESVLIAEDATTRTMRRGDGAIIRTFKTGQGYSMPQWLKYGIESRADWEAFRSRLNPDSPGRLPQPWNARLAEWRVRDYPLGIQAGSFYGVLRDWIGVERLSELFYDDPAWIGEMLDHLADLYVRLLDRVIPQISPRPDYAGFWEDMAFKNGPLISPRLFHEFLVPRYRRVTHVLRDHGIDCIFVDSDGNIDLLIDGWLAGGVNGFHPMEIAAGTDPLALRAKYGQRVLLRGGIDKRALAVGGETMRREVTGKVPALARAGGYVPYVDHDTPPDVSWANFQEYSRLVMKAAQIT